MQNDVQNDVMRDAKWTQVSIKFNDADATGT